MGFPRGSLRFDTEAMLSVRTVFGIPMYIKACTMPMKRFCCLEFGKNSMIIIPQWWHTIANTDNLRVVPSTHLTLTNPQSIWYISPGPVSYLLILAPCSAMTSLGAGIRNECFFFILSTEDLLPLYPNFPLITLSITFEFVTPLVSMESSSLTSSLLKAIMCTMPALPCGSSLKPFAAILLALCLEISALFINSGTFGLPSGLKRTPSSSISLMANAILSLSSFLQSFIFLLIYCSLDYCNDIESKRF